MKHETGSIWATMEQLTDPNSAQFKEMTARQRRTVKLLESAFDLIRERVKECREDQDAIRQANEDCFVMLVNLLAQTLIARGGHWIIGLGQFNSQVANLIQEQQRNDDPIGPTEGTA